MRWLTAKFAGLVCAALITACAPPGLGATGNERNPQNAVPSWNSAQSETRFRLAEPPPEVPPAIYAVRNGNREPGVRLLLDWPDSRKPRHLEPAQTVVWPAMTTGNTEPRIVLDTQRAPSLVEWRVFRDPGGFRHPKHEILRLVCERRGGIACIYRATGRVVEVTPPRVQPGTVTVLYAEWFVANGFRLYSDDTVRATSVGWRVVARE